jgi:hypothetical protein
MWIPAFERVKEWCFRPCCDSVLLIWERIGDG